jgi:large subunit ribosomal protein L29
MKPMKVNELLSLSSAELEKKQAEIKKELFNLRFQLHTGRLENTAQIANTKRTIARVQTLLNQKKG